MSEPKHLSAGPHGPVDKQTIGFQGRYKDKQKSNSNVKDINLSLTVIVIMFFMFFSL